MGITLINKILVSLFSGLSFEDTGWITFVRVFFFLSLIIVYDILIWLDFDNTGNIVISAVTAFVVLAIFITIRIVRHRNTARVEAISEGELGEDNIESEDDIICPDGIDSDLWKLRARLYTDGHLDDEKIIDLIGFGFDPNAVFNLFVYLFSNRIEEPGERRQNTYQNKYCRCPCGAFTYKKVYFHIIFPFLPSILEIIIGVALAFFSTFVVLNCAETFTNSERIAAGFILGPSLYSMLQPPSIEPYSTTIGSYQNGLTRCFFLSLVSMIIIITADSTDEYVQLINWGTKWIFLLLPIWLMLGIIGLPLTFINWVLEVINRYVFGLSGGSYIGLTLAQFFRSLIISGLNSFLMTYFDNIWMLPVAIFIATFFLLIPLVTDIRPYGKEVLLAFILSIISLILSIIFHKYCKDYGSVIEIIAMSYSIIVDFVLASFTATSDFILFRCQLFKPNMVYSFFKFVTPVILCPIVMSSVMHIDQFHLEWSASAIVITHMINRAYNEPHVFAVGIFIARFMFEYDYVLNFKTINLILGMIISRKIFSILPTLDFFRRSRNDYCIWDDVAFLEMDFFKVQLKFLGMIFLVFHLPNVDRSFSAPSLIWSLITGAPSVSFSLKTCFSLFSSPRGNVFWDAQRSYESYQRHPVESPLYTSLLGSLKANLATLIKSGAFGVVDENSFFIIVNENYVIILHIISFDTFGVRFQIRGLEFSNQTICHQGEAASLQEESRTNYYHINPKIMIAHLAKFYTAIWNPCINCLTLDGYNTHLFSFESAFVSITIENRIDWLFTCICYLFMKCNCRESAPEFDPPYDPEPKYRKIYKTIATIYKVEENEKHLKFILATWAELIYKFTDVKIVAFFMGHPKFNEATNKSIIMSPYTHLLMIDSIRYYLLIISLAANMLAPDLDPDQLEPLTDFFEEVDQSYLSTSHSDPRFYETARKQEKDIFTIIMNEDSYQTAFIRRTKIDWSVFRLQRDFVRHIWMSEAVSVIFFNNESGEREAMQRDQIQLHNMIVQSSDVPMEYPAFISPVTESLSIFPFTRLNGFNL